MFPFHYRNMFPDNIIEACFKQVCYTCDHRISISFDQTFTCFHTFFRRVFLFQTKTEQILVETNVTANDPDPNGTESMFDK